MGDDDHDDIDDIKGSIQNFFGDTSRTRAETREGLEELRDEIEMLLASLRED